MSRIFISHSSADDHQALALREWLAAEGWAADSDVYLDIHPDSGMAAGQRWLNALEEAATRCEAVVFLVSEAWLSSKWCSDEMRLAQTLNKKIFTLLIEDIGLDRLPHGLTIQVASGQHLIGPQGRVNWCLVSVFVDQQLGGAPDIAFVDQLGGGL